MNKSLAKQWANTATWVVDEDILTDYVTFTLASDAYTFESVETFRNHLAQYADDNVTGYGIVGDNADIAVNYARHFLSEVEWDALAQYYVSIFPHLIER